MWARDASGSGNCLLEIYPPAPPIMQFSCFGKQGRTTNNALQLSANFEGKKFIQVLCWRFSLTSIISLPAWLEFLHSSTEYLFSSKIQEHVPRNWKYKNNSKFPSNVPHNILWFELGNKDGRIEEACICWNLIWISDALSVFIWLLVYVILVLPMAICCFTMNPLRPMNVRCIICMHCG